MPVLLLRTASARERNPTQPVSPCRCRAHMHVCPLPSILRSYVSTSSSALTNLGDDAGAHVTEVSACCMGGSWSNGVQAVRLRTAGGRLIYLGSPTSCK